MPGRRRSALLLTVPLTALAVGGASYPTRQAPPSATPYNASGIYAIGERAGWTVSGTGAYRYAIRRDNAQTIAAGDLDLAAGPAKVEVAGDRPEMLLMELTPVGGGKPTTYGAAVGPTGLRPVLPKPADFDAFWRREVDDLRRIPMNPKIAPGESTKPEVEYSTIRLDGPHGTGVYGALARPKAPGRYPAIAVFQWASPPYPLQKAWSIDPASKGFIVLNVEPHDVLPNEPPAYYAGLPETLKNYAAVGRDDRERSAFVEMYLRDVRALDYLRSRPDWDGRTLVVMGGSMGGQQSLAAAGLVPQVTHLIVEEPAGCDLAAGLHGRQEGYPFFPTNDPRTIETARYVDAVNFAPKIRATSLVAMGFVDTVAPPTGIWTAFNEIRAPKEAAPMRDAPHNNLATREQLMPIIARREDWLNALAKTGKVEVRKP